MRLCLLLRERTEGKQGTDMEDLSVHILDIAQNSIDAGAENIEISIDEDRSRDTLTITIKDDGKGLQRDAINQLIDPFYTTKGKKTGLGIPLLAQSAHEAGGDIIIESEPEKGMKIMARFSLNHIDIRPLGDLTSTLLSLIYGNPEKDVIFSFRSENGEFRFDTRELKDELGGVPLNFPGLYTLLRKDLSEGINGLRKGGYP